MHKPLCTGSALMIPFSAYIAYYARQAPTDPLRTIICSANPGSYTGAILHYEVSTVHLTVIPYLQLSEADSFGICRWLQQNRCYSLREFARGQGFGDWWRFEGKPHEVSCNPSPCFSLQRTRCYQ